MQEMCESAHCPMYTKIPRWIDRYGTVNGSFLKADLIDELSLVLAPVADGRMGIPTVFDADSADSKRTGTKFRLKSVKRLERDFLWLRYAKA